MKKNNFYLGLSLGAFVWLMVGCKQKPAQPMDTEYKVMTVERQDRMLTQNYTAVINGRQSVEIRPQVSGTITEVCINEGATLHKGQTLFVIDQVPYKAALQTAVANVKSAEAAVATA
mgnify:FL=1